MTLSEQIEGLIAEWDAAGGVVLEDINNGCAPVDEHDVAATFAQCHDQLAALLPAVRGLEQKLQCAEEEQINGKEARDCLSDAYDTLRAKLEAAEQRVHELERERAEAVEICALYAQCEFCDESVDPGGNPHHMPVCNTCWNSANEGSGWMQRAIKAEQRVRELETELARVNQEHENLHRYCDTITREHVDMEARALAAEQRVRELEAELSRIRLIVRGMQVGTEVAEAEEIARLKGERP